jgi:predicted transcriptional regulator/transcriptional regulator with XRE-family HTH domain
MAADLDISAPYVALLERNQRPVTADMLLRLACTYKIDLADLAGDGGADHTARMQAVLKEPMFADIDIPPLEISDIAIGYPGLAEAFLRLYTAYREEQLALADRRGPSLTGPASGAIRMQRSGCGSAALSRRSPQQFRRSRRCRRTHSAWSCGSGWFIERLRTKHNLRVRHLPPNVMLGAVRRLDRHHKEILFDDLLDTASFNFQLAQQLAYLEFEGEITMALKAGQFTSKSAELLAHRSLASYAAAALIMPYSAFVKAAETRRYDMEALARQFGTSFEQTAHRITTLQRPGSEKVPFFLIRVDPAGNISKLLDGAGFPFAKHGGACPLWSVHGVFKTPRQIVTQWLELPDGQRFFSIARTVTAGRLVRRAARGACHRDRLCRRTRRKTDLYQRSIGPRADAPTPIGVACRVCHRPTCAARSELPIGRELLPDDYRRLNVPFGFRPTKTARTGF